MTLEQHRIRIAHGSGGLLTGQLIKEKILKYFKNPVLKKLEDSADIRLTTGNIALTTDSYVIDPIFFPGGDIGKLAVCGTVNDLAMKGAIPKYLSFAMIIEEGFKLADLDTILKSAATTAQKARINIVCGDTKVVEKNKADRIFITTSGIGIIKMDLDRRRIRLGDAVIVSGTIGDHGVAVMNKRLDLGLRSNLKSDVAPLNSLIIKLFKYKHAIRFMRDPTRGGVAAVLNEMVYGLGIGVCIREKDVPIKKQVIGATDILGIDPLYIANEGKFIAVVEPRSAQKILGTIKRHGLGKKAAIIGEIVRRPGVWLETAIGGIHPLLHLTLEGLPRIC